MDSPPRVRSEKNSSAEHAAALRGAGLRATAPRLAVLEVITEGEHVDAEAIAARVRDRLGAVSKQAIYDVLAALTQSGLVRKVAVSTKAALYERHRHDNHHHLVCRECGRLEDVPCATGEAPCLHVQPVHAHGFVIDEADVVYRGSCPSCADKSAP